MAAHQLPPVYRHVGRGNLVVLGGAAHLLCGLAARPVAGPPLARHPRPEVASRAPLQRRALHDGLSVGLLGQVVLAKAVGLLSLGRRRVRGPPHREPFRHLARRPDILGLPGGRLRPHAQQAGADLPARDARQQVAQGRGPWLPQELGAGRTRQLRVALHAHLLRLRRGRPVAPDDEGPRLEHDLRHGPLGRRDRPPLAAWRLFGVGAGLGLRVRDLRVQRFSRLVACHSGQLRGHLLRLLLGLRGRRQRDGPQAAPERPEEHLAADRFEGAPGQGGDLVRARLRPGLAAHLAGYGQGPPRRVPREPETGIGAVAGRRHQPRRRGAAHAPGAETEANPPHPLPAPRRRALGVLLSIPQVGRCPGHGAGHGHAHRRSL
mmetsp:Transcript_1645/g.4580  ORF Transcript_1645/g.4580 Transcript_1645/m.4580 type:complete len:377 (-) Transcript_1645:3261-4391(-)